MKIKLDVAAPAVRSGISEVISQAIFIGSESRIQDQPRSTNTFYTWSKRVRIGTPLLVFVFAACAWLSGCGNAGYPGAGLAGLSRSTSKIDGGQSISVQANLRGSGTVVWSLTGTGCPANGCGTISGNGPAATYTAPAGAVSPFQVMVIATLAGTNSTAVDTITVNPDPAINGNPPAGTVGTAYSTTFAVTGGTGTDKLILASGVLPAGLSLNPATGVLSGTPTSAGTATFVLQATDSSDVPYTVTANEKITISNAAVQVTVSGNPISGTVGTPYSSALQASGGTGPYTFSVVAGALPSGLVLAPATGVISGTPTVSGTANFTVQAQDANGNKGTDPLTIAIAAAPLTLATGALPNGAVGSPYSATIGVTGGTPAYNCTIVTGALPAGLNLGTGCVVSGTPTMAGTSNLMVKAVDSGNPSQSTTGPLSLTIVGGATLSLTSPPAATANTPYSGTIGVTGGTAPYTCNITSGTLPSGLSLANNCVISGTPTAPGSVVVTVQATDASQPAATTTGPVTVTVNAASPTLTLSSPPIATVNTPYTGTIGVTGGTGPYSCVANSALPSGLTLTSNGCVINGTPTATGTTSVSVTATDSSNPAATTTAPVSVTVQPVPTLTFTGSLPNATLNQPYTQTLHASGGLGPYTYALTGGNLPAGLNLSPAGVISGVPSTAGASNFTVTATDSEGTPQTASLPLVLLVVYPASANVGLLNGPYAFLFQGYDDAVAGVLAYQTATIGSFTADGTGVLTSGELDSNHQTSNPTGTTIPTDTLVGTYTIGADNRGLLTITTLHADGSAAKSATYAIAVKEPTAPATTASSGSFIEFDNNQPAGTKGSGTFLAQTPSAFATGLKGSYAFGVQGDVVCFPACTVGVVGGPAAAVGQFAADGAGAISGGTGDETISSTNTANSPLSGSYGVTDGNGRVQLSLTTSNMPLGEYPVDYTVYIVDANRAFLMSTDKHSAYILLAGSATLQTQTDFSNASLQGPFVGYENSPTNPGLVGATLQNVLNLSTATIFRGTGNGSGTCTTTNVDVGGTTGLVNVLTGSGGDSNLLNTALGSYEAKGDSSCTASANGREVLSYPVPGSVLTPGGPIPVTLPANPPPPRVVYLYGPNQGYFLETGYAGLGNLEAQTGAPFSLATLNGTYVYISSPAAAAASTDTSGVFTADGNGHATTTTDLNVGVGTINPLQLGVTGGSTYTLSDATEGKFLLGPSTVIYAISPNRFVLLDTSATTTSPSVALLY